MKRNRASCFLAALLPLMLSLLCGCQPETASTPKAKTESAIEVKTTHPFTGEITRSVSLPANILANQQAILYAKVAGYLKTITVDKGDVVKEGQLLADIEVPELLADLAKSKAELDVAKLDYDRIRDAQAKAPDLVVPQSVDNAAARLAVAKANLERIETLLRFAKITAPFSGVITRRFVDPGAFIPAATSGSVAQSATILTLADYKKVRVQIAVPESEVPHIVNGLRAQVSVEELQGIHFDGEVTRYSHALDESTRTMLAEIDLDNPKRELRPGMYANVRLFVERKQGALLLPLSALSAEKTRYFVFTVSDDKAKKTPVKIGFSDQSNAEILEGVAPDQLVILLTKINVTDGQSVVAREAK